MSALKPINPLPYEIYTLKYVQDTYEKKKAKDKNIDLVIVDHCDYLKGALVYEHRPFSTIDTRHIEFYALSEGWEKLTDTGYFSHFITTEEPYTPDALKEFWHWFCLRHDLNIIKPEPQQITLL